MFNWFYYFFFSEMSQCILEDGEELDNNLLVNCSGGLWWGPAARFYHCSSSEMANFRFILYKVSVFYNQTREYGIIVSLLDKVYYNQVRKVIMIVIYFSRQRTLRYNEKNPRLLSQFSCGPRFFIYKMGSIVFSYQCGCKNSLSRSGTLYVNA